MTDQVVFDDASSLFFSQINLKFDTDSRKHQSQGGSSDAIALEYFSTVNESRTRHLYELYKADFLMFNYDPTPYFIASRKNK